MHAQSAQRLQHTLAACHLKYAAAMLSLLTQQVCGDAEARQGEGLLQKGEPGEEILQEGAALRQEGGREGEGHGRRDCSPQEEHHILLWVPGAHKLP